jgi:hypothetical protein
MASKLDPKDVVAFEHSEAPNSSLAICLAMENAAL